MTFVIIPPLVGRVNRLKTAHKDDPYIFNKETSEYEHRHIAKQILKRNLLPNEIVHHINGKRSDNRAINLCVMDRYEHELFHAWLDWKRKKSGQYPSFKEQKRLLYEKHDGILLENHLRPRSDAFSPQAPHTFVRKKSKIGHAGGTTDFSHKLFCDLKKLRSRLAHEKNIPAYLVFKNFTLTEMTRMMPEDTESMKSIIGVTSEKLRIYGDDFLAVIWKHKKNSEELKKRRSV